MRPAAISAARVGSALGEAASCKAFVCRECLARGTAIGAQGQRRSYADKKKKGSMFDSETWRKKIWGTENPPGPKDPYTQSQLFPERNQKPAETESSEAVEARPRAVPTFEGSSIEDAKNFDPDYEPAESAKGLDRIGGAKGWWEQVWDEDNQFQRWAPPTVKDLDPKAAAEYIHRAFVEITTLHQAGQDINDVCYIPYDVDIDYNQIRPSGTGADVTLSFPEESWKQEIIDAVSSAEGGFVEEEADAVTPTEGEAQAVAEDLAEPVSEETSDLEAESLPQTMATEVETAKPKRIDWAEDADWRHIKVTDEKIKFALAKRVMQLTGTKIPDYALSKANELGLLMQQGFRWKRPERLAKELLTESKEFKKNKKWNIAPNVTVLTKRETYVNREKSVGRWKVIEKELKKRELHLPRRSNRAFS